MKTSFKFLLLAAAACTPEMAMAQAAGATGAAESAASNNGDIIVTATRRETRLQETPLAVTALGTALLESKGVEGLSDLPNGSIPGLTFVPNSGTPSVIGINARGIGSSDPVQGTQEQIVPLYIDGVPLGRAQGLGLDLIDPERIEFLRGPQGQLFGRNAEGGAVQFVSKRPSGKFGFDAKVGGGSYNANRERLRVDLPEFANIRLQASIVHDQHDGFTKNIPRAGISKQYDYGFLKSLGFRIAAEWNPIDTLRVNYAYDNTKIDDSQPDMAWVPVDILGVTPFSPQPVGVYYPATVNSPTYADFFRTKSSGHSLTVQYTASDHITLKSITSYRESSRHGSTTLGDSLPIGINNSTFAILRTVPEENVDQNQWYQEVQAIGSWDRFDITTGATYYTEKVVDGRKGYATGDGLLGPAADIVPSGLAFCQGLELCLVQDQLQHAQSKSYGVYAQATYRPIDAIEITAGIRYSDDKKTAVRDYNFGPITPLVALFRAKRWDPAVTLKYNFSKDINVYARYATAYRAGGANVRSSTFTTFGAEEVKTWEVGLKSQFLDHRVTFNLAWYHNDLKNQQQAIQEAPTTNPGLTNTVNLPGTTKINGVEAELTVRPVDGLTLAATYSHIGVPSYVEFDNPFTPGFDLSRFYAIQSPKHSGSVSADYVTPALAGLGELAFHLDYAWSTPYWTTPGGVLVAALGPTYSRPTTRTNMLNGRVALRDMPLGPLKGEISLTGKNLTKDTHYVYGFDGAAFGGGFAENLVAPRTFMVEFRVKY